MKWRALGVIFLTLLVAGFVLQPVQRPAWNALRENEPALDLASLEGALGQGITVGLLGGFRALVANFMWLRLNAHWEKDDLPNTQTMIQMVTTVDPRPLFFWLNGSRMIAYDMSVWRVKEIDPSMLSVPDTVVHRIDDEQGQVAIHYLNRALQYHPEEPRVYVEIANVYQRKRRNLELAAEYYKKASLVDNPPAYAARIYAELLKKLERYQEAYDWLKDLYPTLDPASFSDRSSVVLERIRELENILEVPEAERFQPPFAPQIPSVEQ